MDKYLTRDAVLDVLFEVYGTVEGDAQRAIHHIWERVKELPDADVVEVVRCKDCEHLGFKGFREICDTGHVSHAVSPDSFCSFGKRRTDNA